jgi:hypothetical protein
VNGRKNVKESRCFLMSGLYQNVYDFSTNPVRVHVFGGIYEAELLLDVEDARLFSATRIGLVNVGKVGSKKVYPYIVINRRSVSLVRILLNVSDSSSKVEHRNNNQFDLSRKNLYVVAKNQVKSKEPKAGRLLFGIEQVKQKNGKITGYKLNSPSTGYMHFSAVIYGSLDKALIAAKAARFSLEKESVVPAIKYSGL